MYSEIIDKFNTFGIQSHWMPNAVGLWRNEMECLLWCALNSPPDCDWLEIGSFCGGSAVLLCLAKQHKNDYGQVISVDINFNKFFDHNVYKRGHFRNISRKLEIDSSQLSLYLKHEVLGFVFIDGFHSFNQVIKDFESVLPYLHHDAIVAFHDVPPNIVELTEFDFAPLFKNTHEDFYIAEAIQYICKTYNFKLIDIPPKDLTDTHFNETRLTQWVRGKTSPFNALAAIRRK